MPYDGMIQETLRYGGVDLRSLGCTFDAELTGLASTPPIRGQNLLIPYQHGSRWAQKFYGERFIVLQGSVASGISRRDWQAKVDQVKALFPIGAGEQRLECQWQDGSFRYCMAEVHNTLGLEWPLPPWKWSGFSIELVASDPFWYGSALEATAARLPWYLDGGSYGPQLQGLLGLTLLDGLNQYTSTIVFLDDAAHWLDQTAPFFAQILTASPTNVEATNSGDYATRKAIFALNGQTLNPKFRNLRNQMSVQVNGSYGGNLVVDCGAQQVTISGQPVSPSSVALGAGQTDWLRLEAGENTIEVTTGTVQPIGYQALYSPAFL